MIAVYIKMTLSISLHESIRVTKNDVTNERQLKTIMVLKIKNTSGLK